MPKEGTVAVHVPFFKDFSVDQIIVHTHGLFEGAVNSHGCARRPQENYAYQSSDAEEH